MWIVRLALRRPYTFVVMSLLLFILGPVVMLRTPVDIFPNIDIPVVSVVWNYAGLSPQQLSDRIVVQFERSMTTTVNDIEHTESQTLNGVSVIKVFFRPTVNISQAVAQITASRRPRCASTRQGTTPPLVIQYSASSVPVLQLGLSGTGLTEQQLNDFGTNFIRTQLATVQGASMAFPYGGKQRQVQVDIDTQKLQAYGLSASDVVNAMAYAEHHSARRRREDGAHRLSGRDEQRARLDRGAERPADQDGEWRHHLHSRHRQRSRWVSAADQHRARRWPARVLLTIQKTGNSSTLDIISGVRSSLPLIKSQLPPALQIRPISDQSIFVRVRDQRRRARGADRRLPDGRDDPGLPR